MKNPFVEEKEEKEEKMIGGYVPIDMANYLRLSSIHQERSLQNLLIEILSSWRVTQGKLPDTMIEHLAQKAFAEWEKWEWAGYFDTINKKSSWTVIPDYERGHQPNKRIREEIASELESKNLEEGIKFLEKKKQ